MNPKSLKLHIPHKQISQVEHLASPGQLWGWSACLRFPPSASLGPQAGPTHLKGQTTKLVQRLTEQR
jgi:hypothetical protein